jgi:hypothetical protein
LSDKLLFTLHITDVGSISQLPSTRCNDDLFGRYSRLTQGGGSQASEILVINERRASSKRHTDGTDRMTAASIQFLNRGFDSRVIRPAFNNHYISCWQPIIDCQHIIDIC